MVLIFRKEAMGDNPESIQVGLVPPSSTDIQPLTVNALMEARTPLLLSE